MTGNIGNHSLRNTMNTKDLYRSLQSRVSEIFLENLIDNSEHNYEPGWVDVTHSQYDWEEFWKGDGI